MLVLTRHENEVIVITTPAGERIRLVVIKAAENRRAKTRLGIDAPSDHQVHRAEVQERIDLAENRGRLSARVAGATVVWPSENIPPVQAACQAVEKTFAGRAGKYAVTVWNAEEGSSGPIWQFEVTQEEVMKVTARPLGVSR